MKKNDQPDSTETWLVWIRENSGKAKDLVTGIAVGAARNAANYIVKTGDRRGNILIVCDKNSISSLGNPRSFARIDMPHGTVPFSHINVNPKITGVPDPHIPISELTAKSAGVVGRTLGVVSKISPVLTVIAVCQDAYQIANGIGMDYENGTKRNTMKVTSNVVGKRAGAAGGATLGASIGTLIFPGVGTMALGLVGALVGGVGGGRAADAVSEVAMDTLKIDIILMECESCHQLFECKKYETGDLNKCENCRTPEELAQSYPDWSKIIEPVVLKIKSKL